MTATPDGGLFDVVPSLAEIEGRITAYRERRESLLAELRVCDQRLDRLTAVLHALRDFAADFTAAATATRLAEGGWSGTGEQLVATTRAVLAGPDAPGAAQPTALPAGRNSRS